MKRTEERWNTRTLRNDARTLKILDYDRCATDDTFKQSHCISKNMTECKKYFAKKDNRYRYKLEQSVLQRGI